MKNKNWTLEDISKKISCYLSNWGYLSIDIPPEMTQSHWVSIGIDLYNKEFC